MRNLFFFILVLSFSKSFAQFGEGPQREVTKDDYVKAEEVLKTFGLSSKAVRNLKLSYDNGSCDGSPDTDGSDKLILSFDTKNEVSLMQNSIRPRTSIYICNGKVTDIMRSDDQKSVLKLLEYKCFQAKFNRNEVVCECVLAEETRVQGQNFYPGTTVFLRNQEPYAVRLPRGPSSKRNEKPGTYLLNQGSLVKGDDKSVTCE